MTTRIKLWLFSMTIYALFVFWYTDFSGPLSDTEVNQFVTTLSERGSDPDTIAQLEGFLRNDTGRQFLMLNNIDMNRQPAIVESATSAQSADRLMSKYMAHIFPELLKRASHPVIFGTAVHTAVDITGIEDAEEMAVWSDGALFRYRSRRALMEIVANPDLQDSHRYKLAALNKTIAYPIETQLYLGDMRVLLGLVLLSLTALFDNIRLARQSKR
ncbi:hypothetical protein OAT22_01260 [Porticoccaceae bacterium]|jgi:hypothetical protein|nr:hypothetical protein [Porticoccaceae bacterium]MDC1143665.1 hypothetical protein [Porticoccaceae bacterium]MDG2116199.1 hypothetical protein [Porticoccaceae bacterium]